MTDDTTTLLQAENHGEAAAIWWISLLKDPKFDMGTSAPPQATDLATRLKLIAMFNDPDDFVPFGIALADLVNKAMVDPEHHYRIHQSQMGLYLGVDYRPQGLLAEAADITGLHLATWPWKTGMWLQTNQILAAIGDTGELKTIWVKPD